MCNIVRGIDVSKWNPNINWQEVKNSGISFCYIRAGAGTEIDPCFKKHIYGAKQAGLAVGIFWFCYAMDLVQVAAEADTCAAALKPYDIDLPVYYDFEYNTDEYANKQGVFYEIWSRTQIIDAFCQRIQQYGYTAGVYTNTDYIKYKLDYTNCLNKYPLWLAYYVTKGNAPTTYDAVDPSRIENLYGARVWQFGLGTVPGVQGQCDLDYSKDAVPDAAAPVITVIDNGDQVRILTGAKYSDGSRVPARFVGKVYQVTSCNDLGAYFAAFCSRIPTEWLEKV